MKDMLINNKGLTLVELLGVIIILGIISAIAIPSISNIVVNTRIKSEKNNAVLLIKAADLHFIEHLEPNGYINFVGIPTLIKGGYLEDESLVNDTFWIALPQIHPGSAVKQS